MITKMKLVSLVVKYTVNVKRYFCRINEGTVLNNMLLDLRGKAREVVSENQARHDFVNAINTNRCRFVLGFVLVEIQVRCSRTRRIFKTVSFDDEVSHRKSLFHIFDLLFG